MKSIFTKLRNNITEKFISHPKSVCMDYITHCKFAIYMAQLHAYGTYVSVIHAIFPWIYPSAVTELNGLIKERIEQNGCGPESEKKEH